jgi:hypothetical protein
LFLAKAGLSAAAPASVAPASAASASAAPKAAVSSSSVPVGWPKRAYIQTFDTVPPDYQIVVDELKARGVTVILRTTEQLVHRPLSEWDLKTTDLVVGNFDHSRLATKRLGLHLPTPPDYPVCLQPLLHRRVWASTLGEVRKWLRDPKNAGVSVFIKPSLNAKEFAAIVEPKDAMIDSLLDGVEGVMNGLPSDTPVYCSDCVQMLSEFRVYVVDGVIRATCQYRGTTATEHALDMKVVESAVKTLCDSEEGRDLTGFGIDFAVLKKADGALVTALVEVNDGYSLGRYKGLSPKDYTDLLVARWARLVNPPAGASTSAAAKK